ncbi:hypothetical protein [Ruania alba]|nr:hypothetical protein [Ruania alba]
MRTQVTGAAVAGLLVVIAAGCDRGDELLVVEADHLQEYAAGDFEGTWETQTDPEELERLAEVQHAHGITGDRQLTSDEMGDGALTTTVV